MNITIGDIMEKYVGAINNILIITKDKTETFSCFEFPDDYYNLNFKSFSVIWSTIRFFM